MVVWIKEMAVGTEGRRRTKSDERPKKLNQQD